MEGYSLERHKQRVHSNKVCACQQCDAKFTQNDNLQRHVRQVHLGELVVCSFCPYKAKEKKFPSDLKVNIFNDQSVDTRNQVANLQNSILSGVILVVLVLLTSILNTYSSYDFIH